MKNILVIFGGDSPEHDISIITGLQLLSNTKDIVDATFYPIYLSRDNQFFLCIGVDDIKSFKEYKKFTPIAISNRKMYVGARKKLKYIVDIDMAILCLHGGLGENGGVQGFFEVNNIPYSSAGVLGSSICMDKCMTKDILSRYRVPMLDYIRIDIDDIIYDSEKVILNLKKLSDKVILKPSSGGSSIGIEILDIKNDDILEKLKKCFKFSDSIIAEPKLDDFIEINCACIRLGGQILPSKCEKIEHSTEILSFDEKYMSGGNMDKIPREIEPENLSNTCNKIKKLVSKIYKVLRLKGICRFDFLVDRDKIYFNEVNTIPGSMAYYLFDMDYEELIDKVIHETLLEYTNSKNKQVEYNSGVLDSVKSIKLNK